ncbi:MAG: SspB family protein [Asticcacaulis sp.]
MSQDEVPTDLMGYAEMAQDALRGVVKSALKRAASPEGLPGEHHLYISFRTRAPGVSIPADLLARYPDEITIVMQHQYRDLAPGETFFSVTLSFGGQPKHLSVPYAAVTRFTDPYAQFGLEFHVPEAPAVVAEPEPETASDDSAPKIVSLDQFRKK